MTKSDPEVTYRLLKFMDKKLDQLKGEDDECWEWDGTPNPNGYPKTCVVVGEKEQRQYFYFFTHRASYQYHYGPIPEGKLICHKCDNPRCINPNHLFLGTHQDNMDDMKKKGRGKKKETPLPRDIIKGLRSGTLRVNKELAQFLGYSQSHLWDIRCGKCHRDVA